jgi:hypothetical protein
LKSSGGTEESNRHDPPSQPKLIRQWRSGKRLELHSGKSGGCKHSAVIGVAGQRGPVT